MEKPVPTSVQSEVVAVCRDSFHWRDDVKAVLLASGVPEALYNRYEAVGGKAKIARGVLIELQGMGPAGWRVQRKIVEELCGMDRPHRDAPDQRRGRTALADLKRKAVDEGVLVDPEKAAADARRTRAQREEQAREGRRQTLGALREQFLALVRAPAVTVADRQRRGYELESLLADLFAAYDVDYRRPYRQEHEQVDGSFHFRGFTYIVEVRWRGNAPEAGDLADFKMKVDGKLESTRGLFISMSDYDSGVIDYFMRTARGGRNNIVLFDGRDLTLIFEGQIGLVDALTAKIDAAEQEGQWWHPLGR